MRNAFTRRRVAAGLAAVATASLVLNTGTAALANTGPGVAPNGGVYNPFLEKVTYTANPANAIVGAANTPHFWGHEGAGTAGTPGAAAKTFFSGDQTDGGAAMSAAFGVTDPSTQVGVAFVLPGNEQPTVTNGELAGNAFQWFTAANVGSSVLGNSTDDGGLMVNNQTAWNAWVTAGQPAQVFKSDGSLTVVDSLSGTASGTHAQGTSLFNTWAANTNVELVYFAISGFDPSTGEPLVKAGANGKAVTAWMPFTTVANPNRAVATSEGYQLAVPALPPTTTTLDAQASPALAGQGATGATVTMTAHVAPAAAGETVNFIEGATTIATATTDSTGKAIATATLTTGTHQISAAFPGNSSYKASSSGTTTFTVNSTPGDNTTTALTVPASPQAGTATTLTAAVSDTTTTSSVPSGTIQFQDNGTNIGGPVTLNSSGATPATPWTPATSGNHTITATYTPTNPAFFTPSTTSQTVSVAGSACTTCTDSQAITADVAAGTLKITTPYTPSSPLNVGTLALNTTATAYKGSASFKDIIVTDTRAGNGTNPLPWTATAIAGNLADAAANSSGVYPAGTHFINGENVGLTGLAKETTLMDGTTQAINTYTGTQVTATNVFAAAAANASVEGTPVAPTDGGSLGLGGTPKTILATTAGPGTATYGGLLTIVAPTSTAPGHYTGTVTFTVS